MNRLSRIAAFALAAGLGIASVPFASPAIAQASSTASRDATREQLRGALASGGARSDVNVSFSQSAKNPYNFVGTMKTGLANSDLLEIVISVTKSDTIGFRIYPHYKGGYINLNKAKDASALMTRLLYLNDQNFLFWGADNTKDVFTAFTFTLESGFPSEALLTVLRSIRNTDKFVGELRPMIDGSAPGG